MAWFKKNERKNKIVRTLPQGSFTRKIIPNKKTSGVPSAHSHLAIKVLAWFLIVGFFGVTVYILFFSSLLSINSIDVSGTENINPIDISSTASAAMEGKYFNIFKKNNIILLSSGSIQKALLNKFRKIDNLEITKKFPDKLLIKIKERESSLVLCSGEPCYVIDNKGQAYAMADFVANEFGEQNLIVLRDLSQKIIIMQDVALDQGLIGYVSDIKSRLLNDLDIEIKQEISTPTFVSGDLRVETADGWRIYFSEDIGIDKEIEMLKTILNNSLDKDKKNNLDYIDLRLDNKVYYKLK